MDTGQEKKKVAGNISPSWVVATKRELCNVMHFAISWILLIMKSNVGEGWHGERTEREGWSYVFLVSYGAN